TLMYCELLYILLSVFFLLIRPTPRSNLFPYTTLFRSIIFRYTSTLAKGEKIEVEFGDKDFNVEVSAKFNYIKIKSELQKLAERRSEEHTSELQSRENLVCRLLLEKKKNNQIYKFDTII